MFDHWKYKLEFTVEGARVPSVFAGPSCDSIDIISRDYPAPKLVVGDLVLVPEIGVYSSVAATGFNGFAPADVIIYEKEIAPAVSWQVG